MGYLTQAFESFPSIVGGRTQDTLLGEDLEDTVLSGGQNERMGTSREFLILGKAVLQQESIKSGTKKDE